MEVGNRARKGNLYKVFSYTFFLMMLTISFGAIAEGCPLLTALVPNNASAAVANTKTINNSLIDSSGTGCVTIPKGIFYVSVSEGIKVSSGNVIKGVNSESSILVAADRVAGSVIKRYPPTDATRYVTGVKIQDIGIILNHGSYGTILEMIGIDFTQISGSYISNVYVGTILVGAAISNDVINTLTIGMSNRSSSSSSSSSVPPDKYLSSADLAQGIGIRLCTIAGDPSGGERNIVEKARIWGARIGISIDDTRCLNSAAHGTIVRDSDIQTVEYGIAQQSIYTTGVTLSGNHIQDLVAGGGNTATMLAAYVMFGYTSSIQGGYIEAASNNSMKAIYLGDYAHGIKVDLGYVGMGRDGGTDSNKKPITIFTSLGQLIRMGGYRNQVTGYDQFVSGNWLNFSN